jgi:hypothetical protein
VKIVCVAYRKIINRKKRGSVPFGPTWGLLGRPDPVPHALTDYELPKRSKVIDCAPMYCITAVFYSYTLSCISLPIVNSRRRPLGGGGVFRLPNPWCASHPMQSEHSSSKPFTEISRSAKSRCFAQHRYVRASETRLLVRRISIMRSSAILCPSKHKLVSVEDLINRCAA